MHACGKPAGARPRQRPTSSPCRRQSDRSPRRRGREAEADTDWSPSAALQADRRVFRRASGRGAGSAERLGSRQVARLDCLVRALRWSRQCSESMGIA